MLKEKQYQKTEDVSSVVTAELFGFKYQDTNLSSDKFLLDKAQKMIKQHEFTDLDTTAHAIPPINYYSIFVMTNFIQTKQNHGVCDEVFNSTFYF